MAKKRLLTDDEKRQRRHQRSAEKKNEKELAEGPLFAPLLPQRTAESEYWHWRFNVAIHAGERVSTIKGNGLLGSIQEAVVRRYVCEAIGAETFAKLDAYRWRTYPSTSEYGYSFWCKTLTGQPVTIGYRVVGRRPNGLAEKTVPELYQHSHMTREQFYAMFPYKDVEPPEQFDGGLDKQLSAFFAL